MSEYHKIHTLFKRTKRGEMIIGDWSDPVFDYLQDSPWLMTEKIDGTNIRVIVGNDGGVTLGGRTDAAQLPNKLVAWLQQHFMNAGMVKTLQDKFPDGAVLYGEGFGAGINKGGGNYQPHQSFILFDVKVGDWWLGRDGVEDVAKTLCLPVVPIVLSSASLHEGIQLVRVGFASFAGDFPAEGVVATPVVPLFNRKGERVITKIKAKDWLRAVEKSC